MIEKGVKDSLRSTNDFGARIAIPLVVAALQTALRNSRVIKDLRRLCRARKGMPSRGARCDPGTSAIAFIVSDDGRELKTPGAPIQH